jgi:2-hydroxychromene-2-carboxylate isomerase
MIRCLKFRTFALICVSLAFGLPVGAQDVDWANENDTCVTPEALASVPEMPPIPDVTSVPPDDFWTRKHFDVASNDPEEELPSQVKGAEDVVTEENPLKIDLFYSMRSPYSYLSLFRYAYLHSNYNVDVNVRVIFPIAVRTEPGSGASLSGRWYYYAYSVVDMPRTGLYQGIPFRYANPDPILQDILPRQKATMLVAPMDKQPYITWLTRLGNAAQMEGKTLEFVMAVSPLIWGGRAPICEWPLHVRDAVNSIGMDYDAVIADIQANPKKYDEIWIKNSEDHMATGQGGVPTASFNGEPFFGQDRFNQVFWRLRQNGLTVRKTSREPVMAKPLRWPRVD